MNRTEPTSTYGTESALVPARNTRDASDAENKTVSVYGSTVANQGLRRPAQSTMQVNLPPVDVAALTDQEFITLVNMEMRRRGIQFPQNQIEQVDENAVRPFVKSFADALKKLDWNALEDANTELRSESPAVRDEVLKRVAANFANAMIKACKDQKYEGLDAIYAAIGDSPAFLQMMIQALNDSELLNHHLQLVACLLGKDRSENNLTMVEARSRVIAKILLNPSLGNYYPILETGPVFFLSDDENVFNFPDYAATRKKLITRFQSTSRSEDCSPFLKSTPKRLPPDALEVFPRAMANWPELKLPIVNFLLACRNAGADVTTIDRLMNRFDPRSSR
jgi:uncharacterized protein YbaR (Trm112 family)